MAARHRGYGPTTTENLISRSMRHDPDTGPNCPPISSRRLDPPADPSQEPMCFPAPVTYCT
ncbi:hypothetical protein GCM10023176_22330 [Micromonospora coerulea]|uniref:Uncharacterized protein n=1 Tax=Micromonospora coerulea TaxID=47856 RepID=A0ABP8SHA5_9ACTN